MLINQENVSRTKEKHVFFHLQVQCGVIPIPKSTTKERIQQNINIFDFKLTDVELNVLDQFHTGHRVALLPLVKHAKEYPFNIEF